MVANEEEFNNLHKLMCDDGGFDIEVAEEQEDDEFPRSLSDIPKLDCVTTLPRFVP